MIRFLYLLITFASTSVILTSCLEKPTDIVNPLDLLANTSTNCNDISDSDNEPEGVEQILQPCTKKRRLENAIDSSDSKKKFKCGHEGCSYAAEYDSTIIIHRRKHTGERPYKCNYAGCTYAAACKRTLKTHKRTHTGQQPYKCNYRGCKYAGKQLTNLIRHKRTHTGEKPFICPYEGCNWSTGDPSGFNRHKKKHRGEAFNNSTSKSAVINLLINAGKNK